MASCEATAQAPKEKVPTKNDLNQFPSTGDSLSEIKAEVSAQDYVPPLLPHAT